MTEELPYVWEYPVTDTPLASSRVLTAWVQSVGSALQEAVGDRALVNVRIDAVPGSAGEVLRVTDPGSRGPEIEILMERLPNEAVDYVFALVEANVIVPEGLRAKWRAVRVDLTAGHVDGNSDPLIGGPLAFSRGDATLVERVAEVVTNGLSTSKRRRWRTVQIALPAYGGSGAD